MSACVRHVRRVRGPLIGYAMPDIWKQMSYASSAELCVYEREQLWWRWWRATDDSDAANTNTHTNQQTSACNMKIPFNVILPTYFAYIESIILYALTQYEVAFRM